MDIVIETAHLKVEAELFETATARAIYQALPIEAAARTWGDEIYFEIPVTEELDETAREVVEAGDLGYWPTGKALCIFFGPTPVSGPGEIRPASAVNIVGRVRGRPESFKNVPSGNKITVSRT